MEKFTYGYGAISDKGDRRTENQDHILCCRSEKNGNFTDAGLWIVADGMGGLEFGSQTSAYAVKQFERWWQEDFPQMVQAGRDSVEDLRELLEQELWDINRQIYEFKEREHCRCGTTISVLLLYNGKYLIENMGDSRIYRFRAGQFRQLTEDQSLVRQMLREGKLEESQISGFKKKNVLTMCLGMFPVPQSEFEMGKLESGDMFLLCSDGLHGFVTDQSMETVLSARIQKDAVDLQQMVCELRNLIPPGGAGDNISIILVGVTQKI